MLIIDRLITSFVLENTVYKNVENTLEKSRNRRSSINYARLKMFLSCLCLNK